MKKRYIIANLILISFLLILSGCGNPVAPEDAEITINPTDAAVTDGGPATWHNEYFNITVKDINGIPLKNVELRIYYIWSVPDTYGFVQLYDGDTPVNSPYYAVTDENGSYTSRVQFVSGGGASYYADLEVTSGSVYASATFSVSASSAE